MSAEQLVRACAESNEGAAWDEFVSRFHRAISLSIIRTACQWGAIPQEFVDDLVQETFLKLCTDKCRLLLEFASQHPDAAVGYIKTIAANVAHDHFKALHSQKRGSGQISRSLEDVQPEVRTRGLGGQEAIEREVLLGQINLSLENCSAGPDQERDRLIFRLYYHQGMSAKAIANLPTVGLTAKGVESAIFRLTRLVRERIVGLQSQPPTETTRGEKGFRPSESY
jgi:RNA polymerase sigma-70 factor, ECF subfamily